MYKFNFLSDDGRSFSFDPADGVFAEIDLGDSVPVKISTSQGFGQIGVTPERESVGARTIKIKGQLRRNIPRKKEAMRRVLTPFTRGRLIFDEYEIRVLVQNPPSFKVTNRDGSFLMRLMAPHPWLQRREEKTEMIGSITPQFHFPVNYAQKHRFGVRSAERSAVLENDGDVKVPFSVRIEADGASANPVVSNLTTSESLRLNGVLQAGDTVELYRDNGVLRAELLRGGETQDILSWVDEKTDFYFLAPGRNVIVSTDDSGGKNISATVSYHEEVVAVYEP